MKRVFSIGLRVAALAVIVAACGSVATPSATAVPASQQPATNAPVASLPPSGSGSTTVAPVDLAGPTMAVGSKWVYVDGMVIVAVPGGTFHAGDVNLIDNKPRDLDEPEFWIYDAEVTNRMYQLCVAIGKCTPPDPTDNPNYEDYRFMNNPVVGVTWQQAYDYCDTMSASLPTERQWEKAARGEDGRKFEWGNDPAPSCDLLNFNYCLGKIDDIKQYENGVSPYGVYDMAGNVREWTADWYDPGFPDVPPQLGDKRSIRSSSFADGGDFAVAAHRYSLKPDSHLPDLGFRCVVKDPLAFAPMCETLGFVGVGPTGQEADCTPSYSCNKVSITEGESCTTGNTPYTIVTFHLNNTPPSSWTYDVPGCKPIGGDQYQCDPPGPFTAHVTGACVDDKTCDPVCPMHYNKVGDVCKWDGTGAHNPRCLPGFNFDPVDQCCSATPGSGTDFNLCPDGYHPVNGVCTKDPVAVVDSASMNVDFKTCTPGTSGGCDPATDPTCNPGGCVVKSCAGIGGTSWNAAKCCCADTGGVCH